MLEVTGLTRVYGSHLAIADISFQVADGELVTIVGPSGCGKSTLLRCVAGLLPPTSGRVVLDGAVVTRVPDRLGGGLPGLQPLALSVAERRRQRGAAIATHHAPRRPAPEARWPPSSRSGLPASPTGTRGNSPAACSSGSRSPVRSRATRCCC